MNYPLSPEVSIIIPCHNEERFIAECLESLRLEENPSWEVIVIDDCSTDNSQKIVNVFSKKFPNVSCRHLDVNVGLGAVRNFGLLLAKGKHIAFLDGDDIVFSDGLRAAVKQMDETGADIVVSPMVRVFGENDARVDNTKQGVFTGPEAFACYLAREFAAWGSCMSIYRRDFLLRNSCVFQTRFYYEDVAFCMRAFYRAAKVITTSESFYVYRCMHSSITRSDELTTLHLISFARLYFDIMQFLFSISPSPRYDFVFSRVCDIFINERLPKMIPVIMNEFHAISSDFKREFMHYITVKDSRISRAVLDVIASSAQKEKV